MCYNSISFWAIFFNSKIFYWRKKTIVIVIFVLGDYRAQVHIDK